MKTKRKLTATQIRAIKYIGQRLAQEQSAYLVRRHARLVEFAWVAGFESPQEAASYIGELLQLDETAGQTVFFNELDWPEALTRIALKHLEIRANDEVAAALEKFKIQ